MECCATSAHTDPNNVVITECPSCNTRGRPVRAITLDALLVAPSDRPAGAYRFCASQRCSVVYYNCHDKSALPAGALNVRVGAKETGLDRPVCYCFNHSAADLRRDVEESGTSTITLAIKVACKAGHDRCAETNPEGRCCLGAVGATIKTTEKRPAIG